MPPFLRHVLHTAIFVLSLWGAVSLVGEPSFMHHHSLPVLLWLGIAYFFGRQDEWFWERRH